MDEKKLKNAFQKVKKDINHIKSELNTLKKSYSLNSEIKKEIKEIKEMNIDKFTTNMENEFKSLNSLIKEFNKRSKESESDMKKFSFLMQKHHDEIKEIKKKLSNTHNETINTELDIKLLDQKFAEFQEIMSEKTSMETASVKLEIQTDIVRLADEITRLKESLKRTDKGENLAELNEMLSEKINLEINSLKMEFTEEIAKLYDRFYNEILDIKGQSQIKPKKNYENSSLKKTKTIKKNPGKLKKAVKWLFVDEDEEEINSIKKEVKKGNKK